MIKHVVLFQIMENVPEEKKQQVMKTFRNEILDLKSIIPYLRHIEVGLNANPLEKWDICLVSDFENMDDLKSYSIFPQHVAAASKLKPFLSGRSCVDFEY